ncbi:MAG: hypothetical protein DRJ38_01335 [Thermoprotei archaeon]|nr:MAG: hypothetical protein DRJ38_01335 [Thermoprotei archaeon]
MPKLSELKPGEEGVISKILGKGGALRRIMDMGLTPGTRIKVVRKAPLGDPIEFEVRGYNLSLRKNEAELILVEVVK